MSDEAKKMGNKEMGALKGGYGKKGKVTKDDYRAKKEAAVGSVQKNEEVLEKLKSNDVAKIGVKEAKWDNYNKGAGKKRKYG